MSKRTINAQRREMCDRLRAFTFGTLDQLRRAAVYEMLDAEREHRAPDIEPVRALFEQLAAGRRKLRAELADFDALSKS